MSIDTATIQKLREQTGVGLMDAKAALEKSDGNYEQAIDYLKKQGQKVAAKKQDRTTAEGTIGSYVHANGKVASLAAISCETDFVAKTDDFQHLAHDIAMQVAATDPQYLAPAEVPTEIIAKEKEIYQTQLRQEDKPESIWEKIIAGKLEKYYADACLVKQPFIKNDDITIEQLIQEHVVKLGENIKIAEFQRIAL